MQKYNSNKLFWILQCSGWLTYFAFSSILISWYKIYDLKDWLLYSITYVLGVFITIGLRYAYRNIYKKIERLYWLPIIIVVGSVFSTVIWTYIDMFISHFFWDNGVIELKQRLHLKSFVKYNTIFIILLTSWSALYFGIKYAIDWQTEKNRTREAQSLAQKAQMEMLRYQLNPHFLFNSLNSIRALVDENQEHAKDMITELSEFLRYSLLHKDATFVTLANEVEAVKHYFSIEKKRFEEKLEISYDLADKTRNLQILTFLLHPLIENAVKYGMKTSKMPLKVGLRTQKTGYGLLVEVCNSGKWVERDSNSKNIGGTGTGLENVKKRLQNAYSDQYRFEILKNDDNICIRIEVKEAFLNG